MLTHTSVYTALGAGDGLARVAVQRQRARRRRRAARGRAPARSRPARRRRRRGRRACRGSQASGRRCCRRRRRPRADRPARRAPRAASAGRRAPGRDGGASVSMLITGTVLCSASSSSIACGPVRTPTAATWRESTSAVSRSASPRESCSSSARSTTAWPPSSSMPTSKDSRVRVEGFWKISATLRPSSAREDSGVGLQLQRAVQQRAELGRPTARRQ